MPTEREGWKRNDAGRDEAIVTLLLQSVTFENDAVDAPKLPLSEEEGILRFRHNDGQLRDSPTWGELLGRGNVGVQTDCYIKIYNLQQEVSF
jgi:hypothetical protein